MRTPPASLALPLLGEGRHAWKGLAAPARRDSATPGELLHLLADWGPDPADRRRILVEGPARLFWAD